MNIKQNKKAFAILLALVAAALYAVNIPCSKILLSYTPAAILAGLLYLGAGLGAGAVFLFNAKSIDRAKLLTKADLPYTIGMVALDIMAPILLMCGLLHTTSATAALLNNFEIVATAVIAFVLFKEAISKRLWLAISMVTLSSIILSAEDVTSFQPSWGSLLVIMAAVCWGFENNCTRKISSKSTLQIVTIKGLCCGIGSLIIGIAIGEKLPAAVYIAAALLLGFVAYGASIFFYIKAQNELGAAKTSAYYAVAPFIGALLSFLIFKEPLSAGYIAALAIMIVGSIIATYDTLLLKHSHTHSHIIRHTHGGSTHTHEITHTHAHKHFLKEDSHHHFASELENIGRNE